MNDNTMSRSLRPCNDGAMEVAADPIPRPTTSFRAWAEAEAEELHARRSAPS